MTISRESAHYVQPVVDFDTEHDELPIEVLNALNEELSIE